MAGRTTIPNGELPSLNLLGRDLLAVPGWRISVSLTTPFLLTVAFFVLAAQKNWIGSIACTMLLTFLTYGSISHDLVHKNLRLPRALNEMLLCTIELVSFRSGHAYRVVHLNHHASFRFDKGHPEEIFSFVQRVAEVDLVSEMRRRYIQSGL